jgi:hypothetical protein
MRKILFVLTASLFVFGKCNKSDEPVSSTGFLPLTSGTFWTYLVTNTGTTTTTSNLTLTVTGKDTTINYNNTGNKTYKVLTSSAGANNYWAIIGSDYYRYGIIPGATAAGNVEELYFKDNLALNGTWTNTFPVNYTITGVGTVALNVSAKYTIAATGQSKTVTAGSSTNTFPDVTTVHVDFSTSYPPFLPTTALGSGDFYYAKGIGLISQSVSITANTQLGIASSTLKWDIQTYQVK